MKVWTIRFRYIPVSQYHTPLSLIPIEETKIRCWTPEEARAKFFNERFQGMTPEAFLIYDVILEEDWT